MHWAQVGNVFDDVAVAQCDDPPRPVGYAYIVGDDDKGDAARVQLVEERQDLRTRFGVERPGWLVGQQYAGVVDQGPRDRDALLLPPESSSGRCSLRSPSPTMAKASAANLPAWRDGTPA